MVQQPETHLHPRLQAEVGTIISKSINPKRRDRMRALAFSRFNKNWVIETHSETLLFRLLKEIRNGNLNKNAEDAIKKFARDVRSSKFPELKNVYR